MQHSLAPLRSAWPARYVRAVPRARERRLGLGAGPRFQAATARRTVLRQRQTGLLAELLAARRAPVIEASRAPVASRPRQAVPISWTRTARGSGPRRPSVAPAWRA